MARNINIAPLTGGTSKLLNFKLATDFFYNLEAFPHSNQIASQNVYLYYKVAGTSGNNKVVTMGSYLEMTLRCGAFESGITPDATMAYTFGSGSWLKAKINDGYYSSIFDYSGDITNVTGSLIDWEETEVSGNSSGYTQIYFVTYRFWLGTADFIFNSGSNKVLLDWNYIAFVANHFTSRDTQTFYISFNNAPYIGSYPSEIIDTESFSIDYLIPDPSATDYISFGILDTSGQLLVGYKMAPKDDTYYVFNMSELDREALYARYSTVNVTNVQLGVRYKNFNEDPVLITFPMVLEIEIDKPTLNYTIKDIDQKSVALTGNDQIIVRNYSDIQISVDPQAYKGASLEQFYIANGNNRVYNQNVVTFSNVSSYTFSTYAIDSRKNSTLKKITLSMVDYFPVTCNIAAQPPRTDGSLSITVSGKYWNDNFGAADNTIRFEYKYISNVEEHSIGWTRLNPTPTLNINQGNYTAYFDVMVPNHADTYTVQVRAIDALNTAISNSVTVKSTPVFDWGQEDFNFNVPVMIQGDLTVTGTINGSGASAADCIVEQGTITTGSGNSTANWVYRKWNSGIAECWCRKHVSTAVNTAWGGLYVSGALSYTNITWGVNFIDIPVANITIAPNASGAFLIAGGSTSLTKTNTGGYEIARGSALSSAGNFYINYYGIGKWK